MEKKYLYLVLKSREYLKEEIEKLGVEVDRVHTYDTVCGEIKNIKCF